MNLFILGLQKRVGLKFNCLVVIVCDDAHDDSTENSFEVHLSEALLYRENLLGVSCNSLIEVDFPEARCYVLELA